MSQSVKFSDGSYLDATDVWDTTQGKTQSALNAIFSSNPKMGWSGIKTFTATTTYTDEIDTANTFVIPKGKNIIVAQVSHEGSDWTENKYCHMRVMRLNSSNSWEQFSWELSNLFLDAPSNQYGDWWHVGQRVGFSNFVEDTTVSMLFWTVAGINFTWEISYINFST